MYLLLIGELHGCSQHLQTDGDRPLAALGFRCVVTGGMLAFLPMVGCRPPEQHDCATYLVFYDLNWPDLDVAVTSARDI